MCGSAWEMAAVERSKGARCVRCDCARRLRPPCNVFAFHCCVGNRGVANGLRQRGRLAGAFADVAVSFAQPQIETDNRDAPSLSESETVARVVPRLGRFALSCAVYHSVAECACPIATLTYAQA